MELLGRDVLELRVKLVEDRRVGRMVFEKVTLSYTFKGIDLDRRLVINCACVTRYRYGVWSTER